MLCVYAVRPGAESAPPPRAIRPLPRGITVEDANPPSLEELGLAANLEILPGGEAHGRRRMFGFFSGPAPGYPADGARMSAASFLTRHLLIDYCHSEAHYLKYLTDGDRAADNPG